MQHLITLGDKDKYVAHGVEKAGVENLGAFLSFLFSYTKSCDWLLHHGILRAWDMGTV